MDIQAVQRSTTSGHRLLKQPVVIEGVEGMPPAIVVSGNTSRVSATKPGIPLYGSIDVSWFAHSPGGSHDGESQGRESDKDTDASGDALEKKPDKDPGHGDTSSEPSPGDSTQGAVKDLHMPKASDESGNTT